MANPKLPFDSRAAGDPSGSFPLSTPEGMPAQFASFDARDHLIARGDALADFVDPGRTAQRKIGDIVIIIILPATFDLGATPQYPTFVGDYAAHETIKKAWDDGGWADYYENAGFPFKVGVFVDTSPANSAATYSVFPLAPHVSVQSGTITGTGGGFGVTIGNFAQSLAGSNRITAAYVGFNFSPFILPGGFTSENFSDGVRSVIGSHTLLSGLNHVGLSNPTNASVRNTENPYGRNVAAEPPGDVASNFYNLPPGLALKAFYDNLYATTMTNGSVQPINTTLPATIYHEVIALNGSVYFEDQLTNWDLTPEAVQDEPF